MSSDILVIPRRYNKANLEDLNGGFKTLTAAFLSEWKTLLVQGIAPSFFGTSGQGKTYAVAALANFFREVPIEIFWCSALEDLEKLRNYSYFRQFSDWHGLTARLQKSSILILDDITQVSQYKQLKELFNVIISKRYNAGLPVIFTGNLSTPTKDNFLEEISSCFGMAMCRRIEAMSKGFLHIA